MSVLFYRRPDYMNPSKAPLNKSQCARYVERAKGSERAIPEGLAFESVISNKALPPCSLGDFMDYLVYIERNAENLQFFLWYKDYCKRWELLTETETKLSPAWIHSDNEAPKLAKDTELKPKRRSSAALAKIFKDSNWDEMLDDNNKDFADEIKDSQSFMSSSLGSSAVPTVGEAQANVGLKWKAFTIQPQRDECDHIIRHYLAFNAPRELNLSHKDRASCLHALQHTTHPSAFLPALRICEATLRGQSHPNFIRWSICNGNQPRVFFVRSATTVTTFLGFLLAILLTLSTKSRWWRIWAFPLWVLGFSGLIAAYKGLCVLMHKSHNRALRPWEQFEADLEASQANKNARRDSASSLSGARTIQLESRMDKYDDEDEKFRPQSLQTFGARNSWEDEDWVRKYEAEGTMAKIFARETWVQDETLRLLQDKIVLGANLWAVIISLPLTVIFVALPKGNLI